MMACSHHHDVNNRHLDTRILVKSPQRRNGTFLWVVTTLLVTTSSIIISPMKKNELLAVDAFQWAGPTRRTSGGIRSRVSSLTSQSFWSTATTSSSFRERQHQRRWVLFLEEEDTLETSSSPTASTSELDPDSPQDTATGVETTTTPRATTSREASSPRPPAGPETASTEPQTTSPSVVGQQRVLGSQELLMLPRQYAPGRVKFPSMDHVSCTVLSATPSLAAVQGAVADAGRAHPLLRAHVQGTGEPHRRIDLFQMVREGEPDPLTFVAPDPLDHDDDDASTETTRAWVGQVLQVVHVPGSDRSALEAAWQEAFSRDLDDGRWCNVSTGPLWKLTWFRLEGTSNDADESMNSSHERPCAMLLSFNHAISDQSSANRLMDQMLRFIADWEQQQEQQGSRGKVPASQRQGMPCSLEESVLGPNQQWSEVQTAGMSLRTLGYVAGKAAEGFKSPVVLPDPPSDRDDNDDDGTSEKANSWASALTLISGKPAGGEDRQSEQRKSTVQFRSLSKENTKALLERCRERGVSVSNALTAAMTLTASDFIGNGQESKKTRNYKVLQSLDMRRFGSQIDKGETVACMAGSMDLMHGPIADRSGAKLRENADAASIELFWSLAQEGKKQTESFIKRGGPEEAVRVWDFAMSVSDLNNLVYLTSQSKDSKGRGYSAGVTNAGVYERIKAFQRQGEADSGLLRVKHGKYRVEDVFYATPHTQSGCLYPVSCLTIDGQLKMTFNPVEPIVDETTNIQFANAMVELLEVVSQPVGVLSRVPNNVLTITTSVIGLAAVLTHAPAWAAFFASVAQMKANVADPADFWAALNFWIFFAVGHPILQPILWVSDVLHASPGPLIAGLVPASFVALNVVAIGAIAFWKDLRQAVNIAALAAFFAYVGAGLEGTGGLGDYNLALDDSYQGQIVRGCPTYEEVRQPSMNDFELAKYQGLWYEQKFHDWTQFKEVYDTTLSIKLTENGQAWVDDFAVKGPAPDAATLSWDKSPVANGAHYFLFGRVDERDPPGVLRESGFGVEFPNYIVDVQKDPATGEYTESIQFQCLERGGVRVFEGINFMSRQPFMSDEALTAMHARAAQAGMYPYGASPEQMHTVARRPVGAPAIDNAWQQMWRAIGFDRLLEQLTEAIEDGGR